MRVWKGNEDVNVGLRVEPVQGIENAAYQRNRARQEPALGGALEGGVPDALRPLTPFGDAPELYPASEA